MAVPLRCQQASLPSPGAAQRVTNLGSGLRKWLLLLDVFVVAVVVAAAAAAVVVDVVVVFVLYNIIKY